MASDSSSVDAQVLLLVDVLGTKAVWAEEGRDGASELFATFARLVERELGRRPERVESGAIESDCAALICPNAAEAVSVGIGLYRRAFFYPKSAQRDRLWLRGVIVPLEGPADVKWLRQPRPLSSKLAHVSVEKYSGDLLDALAMEKAGFRGMRLLMDPALDTRSVRGRRRISLDGKARGLYPFRHLERSSYGKGVEDHIDVLWMATGDWDKWRSYRSRMSGRLRYSAESQDEVLQAAATQLVFDECDSIMNALPDS